MHRLPEPEHDGQRHEAEGKSSSGPPHVVTRDSFLQGAGRHDHAREGERGDLKQVDRIAEPFPQVGSDAGHAHRTADQRHEDEPEPKASQGRPEAAHRGGLVL